MFFRINGINVIPLRMTRHSLGWVLSKPLRMRYIARAIEERGTAAVIVLTKWDAVPNKVSWPSKMPEIIAARFFFWNHAGWYLKKVPLEVYFWGDMFCWFNFVGIGEYHHMFLLFYQFGREYCIVGCLSQHSNKVQIWENMFKNSLLHIFPRNILAKPEND